MDLGTLLGLLGGFGIVIGAIMTGSEIGAFVNVPSILVVFGGTIFAILIRFPVRACLNGFKVAMKAFKHKMESPTDIITRAVDLAGIARKEGLLALESQDVGNDFFQKGLRLCVDGLEPEFVRKLLTDEMDKTIERHEQGQQLFKAIGDAAPAMGMIGTLIGLVQLLGNMSDPSALGPAMAVALLTTLYGSIIANIAALPIADKLSVRTAEEVLTKTLVIEAITSIQEGRNPRVMEEFLRSYLPSTAGTQAAVK